MSCPPDAHCRSACDSAQVHVGGVHAQHHVEVIQKCKLYLEAISFAGKVGGGAIAVGPAVENGLLAASSSEKEYPKVAASVGVALEAGHHFLHKLHGVYLAVVGGEGGNPYPLLSGGLRRGDCRIALVGSCCVPLEETVEFLHQRQPGLEEGFAVACPLRNERQHHLVVAAGEGASLGARLENLYSRHAFQTQKRPQYFCAQHIVQVDENVGAIVGIQPRCKSPKPGHTVVFSLYVGAHEHEVVGRVDEYRSHRRARNEHKAHIGVAAARAVNHRDGHGDIAKGRKAAQEGCADAFRIIVLRHRAPDWCRRRYTSSSGGTPSCTCVLRRCRRGGRR